MICQTSDFFSKAFNDGFIESAGTIDLPEDSAGAFALFVDWMYRGKVPKGRGQSYVDDLFDLYIFAEKLCLVTLKNKVIDSIQDIHSRFDLDVTPSQAERVYAGTPIESPLRSYCILVHMYHLGHIEDGEKNKPPNAKDEYVDELWKLSKDNFEYFKDMMKIAKMGLGPKDQECIGFFERDTYDDDGYTLIDVRRRGKKNRCWFHSHDEDTDCRAKPN